MKKVFIITGFAIILFGLDFFLTMYYLQNYSHLVGEGNPLALGEYGYISLILNVVYLLLIFMFSFYLQRYQTFVVKANNMKQYIKKIYTSHNTQFIFSISCFVFIVGSFSSRIMVITDWVVFGLYKTTFYETLYANIRMNLPFQRYDIIVGILVGLLAIPLWFFIEYRKSKKTQLIEK